MSTYFPRQLLFRLRNEIPLEKVIAENLNWPSKRREGRSVFVCPRCGDSLTAVNPRTNLSRCFRCEENFNTIDFVMLTTGRDFVEAMHFLAGLLPARPSAPPAASAE
jgi:DNA primase